MEISFDFITLIDHLSTFAFAISGIRNASEKNFDWFGAYIVGLVTAIGGGTTRDLLLQVTPFWMEQPSYLIVTAIALLSVILFSEKVLGFYKTLLLFDTIGLGLFVVVGLEKSLNAGFPFWVCIIMGTITGSVGGVIRDVLIIEIPLLFRRDIYALACVFGGIGYYLCHLLDLPKAVTGMVAAGIVILTRIVAVKYHIQVPTLKSSD